MDELQAAIKETAEKFAQCFQNKGNFDFSIQSLHDVNDFLEEVSDFVFEEQQIYQYYTTVGSYIFEVARRNYGGTYYWLKEVKQPILVAGEPEFFVSIQAWEKAKMYIENGTEDDILFYIDGYREHIEKGKQQRGYSVHLIDRLSSQVQHNQRKNF